MMASATFSALSQGWQTWQTLPTTWILHILAAVVFLLAGGSKLADAAAMVVMFDQIGIGQWFRYVSGGLEVTCAILLLLPTASAIGAGLLGATMVGAIVTHLLISSYF
jgi:putative oxidoreductase